MKTRKFKPGLERVVAEQFEGFINDLTGCEWTICRYVKDFQKQSSDALTRLEESLDSIAIKVQEEMDLARESHDYPRMLRAIKKSQKCAYAVVDATWDRILDQKSKSKSADSKGDGK